MLCLLQTVGFFTSFTVPKLYSCYSSQIHKRGVIHLPLVTHYLFSLAILLSIRLNTFCSVTSVEILRDQALEAWKSCPRKKLVAAMVVTMCWNMFSVKKCHGRYLWMLSTDAVSMKHILYYLHVVRWYNIQPCNYWVISCKILKFATS